jgi:signal transduction histidine kinase
VDDLQELSRVEAGAFQLDLHPLSIHAMVALTVKRLSRQFQLKGVTLGSDVPDDLPDVLADEARLEQIMLNLAGNALQYTPKDGSVMISASVQGQHMRISVADNGIGIPEQHLAHIFDRFYRVEKSRTRGTGGGSGIGLTISKRLVEAHGGIIMVESPGEGQGARFTFTLPLA